MALGKLSNTDRIDCLGVLQEVLEVLGMDNLSILYRHLERLGVKKEQIPDHPEEFSKALRVIFGQGATILERQIISSIAMKTGVLYRPTDNLVDVLRRLQCNSAAN